MKRLWIGVCSISVMLVLGGCETAPTKEQPGAAVEDRGKPGVAKPDTGARPLTGKSVPGDPLKDPGNILSKRSIYFDFDSNLVKDEFKPIVTEHARYLQRNPNSQMRIEGHADERGSREYNLALGQRRADAVRQMMQLLGARASQIESVSFGEEKPRCAEHDENCWWQNRRGDVVYRGE